VKFAEYYGNIQVYSESHLFPTMQIVSDIRGCIWRDFSSQL